jgi:hypothetical protein
MPAIEYPFIRATPTSPLRPMLRIRISNRQTGQHLNTVGLIDTGADECAMPGGFAAILGHDLQAGEVKHIATGNGITPPYVHTCKIEILGADAAADNPDDVVYVIEETPIDFLPNLNSVLLGVGNFLGRFVLTVDYPNRVFSVRAP